MYQNFIHIEMAFDNFQFFFYLERTIICVAPEERLPMSRQHDAVVTHEVVDLGAVMNRFRALQEM